MAKALWLRLFRLAHMHVSARTLASMAVEVEPENDGVVHEAVDGGDSGRGVQKSESHGEHDVAADLDTAPLVAFGLQFKQDFHFALVLLHVADVAEALEAFALQGEATLGFAQALGISLYLMTKWRYESLADATHPTSVGGASGEGRGD